MDLILLYFTIKYKGYYYDIYKALKEKEYIPIDELKKLKEKIDKENIKYITIIDDEYPNSLKEVSNPPFVIFYEGNKNLLKNDCLLFTGEFSNNKILDFTLNSLKEIAKSCTLISQYSKGLDEVIVDYFLKNNKNIILVSPNGIRNPYFASSKKLEINYNNVLIISEFPDDVNLNKRRLIQRNKLSIGLSKFLIIASSYKRSRISNLVTHALDQGKDVYCFPGTQDDNDGNNQLIKDGAILITSIKNERIIN